MTRILAGRLDADSRTGGNSRGAALAARVRASAPDEQQDALDAARQFLAGAAEASTPGTPAEDLLAWLGRYRAHLAAVVVAGSGLKSGAGQ